MFRKLPQIKHIAYVTGLGYVGSQAMMYKYKKAINVEERPQMSMPHKFFQAPAMAEDGKDKPYAIPEYQDFSSPDVIASLIK